MMLGMMERQAEIVLYVLGIYLFNDSDFTSVVMCSMQRGYFNFGSKAKNGSKEVLRNNHCI